MSAAPKFTPGPWQAKARMVEDANGDAVAMVNTAMPLGMACDIARLIAAAPDLFAVLEKLMVHGIADESVMASARAALAKVSA